MTLLDRHGVRARHLVAVRGAQNDNVGRGAQRLERLDGLVRRAVLAYATVANQRGTGRGRQ